MKYVCEIEVPDNNPITKLDLMAQASRDESMWRQVFTHVDRLNRTDLRNKCGSCEHFVPWHDNTVNGCCNCGHVWGTRSRPCCKDYERKET